MFVEFKASVKPAINNGLDVENFQGICLVYVTSSISFEWDSESAELHRRRG
jgi:hypothetical protein